MTTPAPIDLTQAEEVIVRLLTLEFTEPQIAKQTKRGKRTVNQHVRRAMERNRIKTRLGLIRAYDERGHQIVDGRQGKRRRVGAPSRAVKKL